MMFDTVIDSFSEDVTSLVAVVTAVCGLSRKEEKQSLDYMSWRYRKALSFEQLTVQLILSWRYSFLHAVYMSFSILDLFYIS